MRVLLAIDVWHDAAEVIARALPWLDLLGAVVDLVYVDTHRASLERYTPVTFRNELERLVTEADARLEALCASLPPARQGRAFLDATSIEEMLATRAPDYAFVLVGTRGRVGLAHLWAGSVAEHIVRFSPTSVLVLRDPPPATSGTRILLALDLAEDPAPLLEALAPLARRLAARVDLLHVAAPVVIAPTLEAPTLYALLAENTEAAKQVNAERLSALRAAHLGGLEGEALLDVGGAVPGIVRRSEACDLVVVGTHGRVGVAHAVLGSVAERVVRRAHRSVLVLRPAFAHAV